MLVKGNSNVIGKAQFYYPLEVRRREYWGLGVGGIPVAIFPLAKI